MIKNSSDFKIDSVLNLMQGEGEVKRVHLLEIDEFNGYGRLFALHQLDPGCSIGFHKHEGEQESYYILKGVALYSDNGDEKTINVGDFTLCKNGEGHSIKNIGNESLEFIGLIMKA